MARHRMKEGVCRLCNRKTNLSFEHIPPRVAHNKDTRYISVPLEEYFKEDKMFDKPFKGKVKQGGIGYHSLCKTCNNFLGAKYVSAYEKWVKYGLSVLNTQELSYFSFKMEQIEPLKIIKQIISMFLSINNEGFSKQHHELVEFVMNPEKNTLPERYSLYTYLNKEGGLRYMNNSVVGNFYTGKRIVCTELTYPPFGYVLTIDNDEIIEKLTNITQFKNFKLDHKHSYRFSMFQLPTHLSIPLDYRTKSEIDNSVAESNKLMDEIKKNE